MNAKRPGPAHQRALPKTAGTRWPSRVVQEEQGFVLGFLIRAVLWFAVLALVGHDVGQIVWTQVRLSNAAHKGAQPRPTATTGTRTSRSPSNRP